MFKALWSAIVAIGCASHGIASGNELAERAKIQFDVATMVRGERFAELEETAARYRTSRSRTSSGLWHLTLFYAGVKSAFDADRTEGPAQKWLAAFPGSSTAQLARAKALISMAWGARGGGYAGTVERKNWVVFDEHMERARVHLEAQKSIASRDPHWYELMSQIAYAQQWPEARFAAISSEGLTREPLFYQTYFAAIDYHAPKWGGSAAAIERFARDAVQRTKATEGFGMYARIYWYASQTQYGDRLFGESIVDWDTMKRGIDDVLKAYPDSWNTNNFARFACLSGDKAKAAQLIGRMPEGPMPSVWRPLTMFQHCKELAQR